MSIEAMRQARNAFIWNLNTDLDNIPACDKWAKMLRSNIDNLDKAIAEAEQAHWVGVSDERLMEMPEFTKHTVESTADWSDWVCPDPESYLMKCCDCGLVHETQFGVVRYKSETEREDCDKVDDPNLQAVFRMRRHEAWEPEDTAHRAGGLPLEQAQPVAYIRVSKTGNVMACAKTGDFYKLPDKTLLYTTPPQRKPLTDEERDVIARKAADNEWHDYDIIDAVEAAHGIGEKE